MEQASQDCEMFLKYISDLSSCCHQRVFFVMLCKLSSKLFLYFFIYIFKEVTVDKYTQFKT